MRIDGAWRLCDDGVVRPVILGEVRTLDGSWMRVPFLADTAADRTVFSADILGSLGFPLVNPTDLLTGVGGRVATVILQTPIRFRRETGATILFTGEYAAFTDPAALDMSVLGRDLTNLFALIVDRPQDVVCLLGQRHRYVVVQD